MVRTRRRQAPAESPVSPGSTPSPEPRCCLLPRICVSKSKTDKKKQEKVKPKGKVQKETPTIQNVQLPAVSPTLPQLKPLIRKEDREMEKALLDKTRQKMRDASLEQSARSVSRQGGLTYDLVDFSRPPSRAYRCPRDAPLPPPASRMARVEHHHQKIAAQAAAMQAQEERRKQAIENKIMRAHRSTERAEQIREKAQAPLIEAGLKVKQIQKTTQSQSWELAAKRPPTAYRPRSRLPSLTRPTDAKVRAQRAEEALAQAKKEQEAKAKRRRRRQEQSQERRLQMEEAQKQKQDKKAAKITEATRRREAGIHDIKVASVIEVSRAKHLARMKKIEQMYARAQTGCGSRPSSPLDLDYEIESGDW